MTMLCWIQKVSRDRIPEIPVRALFCTVAQQTFRDICLPHLHHQQSQLYALASMFVAGCYCLEDPMYFNPDVLWELSTQLYTQLEIVLAISDTLRWLAPRHVRAAETVEVVRKLAQHETSTCHLVTMADGVQVVRKRIWSAGHQLPAYTAIVELLVHRMLRGAEHPHVATLRAATVEANGTIDLFYDYVPHPLYSFVQTSRCLALVHDILCGVRSLHTRDIAHRDLKMENIHVSAERRAILLDTGAAGYGSVRHTVPACTISYRSPDLLRAECTGTDYTYDGKTLDIWSIGVLILQLLNGCATMGQATGSTTAQGMLELIRRHKPTALAAACKHLTPTQYTVLETCLADAPSQRPTIHAVLDAFGPVVASRPSLKDASL